MDIIILLLWCQWDVECQKYNLGSCIHQAGNNERKKVKNNIVYNTIIEDNLCIVALNSW